MTDTAEPRFRLELDWRKIAARYRDRDLADTITREQLYLDLGVLCGHISKLEQVIADHGWKVAPAEES